MKKFSKRNYRPIAGRVMTGLVFAAFICVIYAGTAVGQGVMRKDDANRYDNKDRRDDRNRYDNKDRRDDRNRYDNKDRRDDRNRYNNKGGRYNYKGLECYRVVHGKRVYAPCRGNERVYVPPRAVYVPPPPPGIRIFLPPVFFPFHR